MTRRFALLGLLAGCGLTPVYGPNGTATVLRNAITLTTPETVAGFRLRTRLEDRFGPATDARYALSVTMSQTPTPATITVDGDTTRFNLVGTADWALSDLNGNMQSNGTVESFTSYSATGSTVATEASATDAAARLSVALADLIAARLILLSAELPQ